MSALPRLINPFRLAKAGSAIEGEVPIRDMPRLARSLCGGEGGDDARVALRFEADASGHPRVTGSVRATLWVRCQRCLEPMPVVVDADVRLAIVSSDAEAARVEADHEPLVMGDGPLETASLVEDELILGLSATPVHERGECEAPEPKSTEVPTPEGTDSDPSETRDNPFAVLEQLKRRD